MTDLMIDLTDARLSPAEDGILRRLFFFEGRGAILSPPLRVLKAELRARDLRQVVREPVIDLTRVPHYA